MIIILRNSRINKEIAWSVFDLDYLYCGISYDFIPFMMCISFGGGKLYLSNYSFDLIDNWDEFDKLSNYSMCGFAECL